MKKILIASLGLLVFAIAGFPVLAQQGPIVLTATTLSAAQVAPPANGNQTLSLTSVTAYAGIGGGYTLSAPSNTNGTFSVFVDRELEDVVSVSGTTLQVRRGSSGITGAHANAAKVWWGPKGAFQNGPPSAQGLGLQSCTSPIFVTPWIDVTSGLKWICGSSLWRATTNDNITFNSDPGQVSIRP